MQEIKMSLSYMVGQVSIHDDDVVAGGVLHAVNVGRAQAELLLSGPQHLCGRVRGKKVKKIRVTSGKIDVKPTIRSEPYMVWSCWATSSVPSGLPSSMTITS